MAKKITIDINKIVQENAAVDVAQLARNLHILKELKEQGINIGPNYNLGSPFVRPERKGDKSETPSSTIQLKHIL